MTRPDLTRRRVSGAVLGLGVVVLALGLASPSAAARGQHLELPPPPDAAAAAVSVELNASLLPSPSSLPAGLDMHDESARTTGPAVVTALDPGGWTSPVLVYRITAEFGEKGRHWTTRHTGLDFLAPRGTPVRAVHDGVVVKLAWHKAYGRMVILEISPGVTLWYCHLSAVSVALGPVTRGQELGKIGSSGNATGPHLHLEVRVHDRPTDPRTYLFGDPPGTPGPVPTWLPPVAINTVANLELLGTH
jgi:murein DD-endopeptidase MepM/ murein hydrolase activator NlpD